MSLIRIKEEEEEEEEEEGDVVTVEESNGLSANVIPDPNRTTENKTDKSGEDGTREVVCLRNDMESPAGFLKAKKLTC